MKIHTRKSWLLLAALCAAGSPGAKTPAVNGPTPARSRADVKARAVTGEQVAQEMFEWGKRRGARDARYGQDILPFLVMRPGVANGLLLIHPDGPPQPVLDAIWGPRPTVGEEWIRPCARSFTAGYAVGHLANRPKSKVDQYLENLKWVGFALEDYQIAHHAALPAVGDTAELRTALAVYVRSEYQIDDDYRFKDPINRRFYRWNVALSGKRISSIPVAKQATTVVLYESTPGADGTRGVLYLNFVVERVSLARWNILKRTIAAE